MTLDKDLQSIQEVRDMMKKAVAAQREFQCWDQARVDALVKIIADACVANVEPLAKMAHEETGFGIWQDKVIKNLLGSKLTYEYIKDMKTVGVIREDSEGAIIAGDVASKAANVNLAFIDRFSGSAVISGDVESVEASLTAVMDALHGTLGFAPAPITRT